MGAWKGLKGRSMRFGGQVVQYTVHSKTDQVQAPRPLEGTVAREAWAVVHNWDPALFCNAPLQLCVTGNPPNRSHRPHPPTAAHTRDTCAHPAADPGIAAAGATASTSFEGCSSAGGGCGGCGGCQRLPLVNASHAVAPTTAANADRGMVQK